MFETSVVLAILLCVSVWSAYLCKSDWPAITCLLAWAPVLFIVHVAMSLPAVGSLYLLLIAATVISKLLALHPRWFPLCCVGCVTVAYGVSVVMFIPIYHEHVRLLARIPSVDFKSRLAYEQPSMTAHPGPNSTPAGAIQHPETVFDPKKLELQRDEVYYHASFGWEMAHRYRALRGLAQVHDDFVADFIAQAGFGVGRLMHYRLVEEDDLKVPEGEELLLKPVQPIPQPALQLNPSKSAAEVDNALAAQSQQASFEDAAIPTKLTSDQLTSFESLNRNSVGEFANLPSLGIVNRKSEAWEFQSHGFREVVKTNGYRQDHGPWTLVRLELVSLLKHQPAAVYVSEHLPAMDELRGAPTRPATTFETQSIDKLRNGDDIAFEIHGQEMQMVGAIRAITECRNCHRIQEGGLLGAFSYRFRVPRTTSQDPAESKPAAPANGPIATD